MSLDLRSLIGKLDDTSRRSLEGAAGLAVSRTHYDVEMDFADLGVYNVAKRAVFVVDEDGELRCALEVARHSAFAEPLPVSHSDRFAGTECRAV